jgi:hypothetical protein
MGIDVIPARKDCYGDWVKEYNGYLYAGHHTHAAASEYICMDEAPGVHSKSSTVAGKKLLHPVKCNGAIPCPTVLPWHFGIQLYWKSKSMEMNNNKNK